ncbi:MAG: CoA pyrophosphatase [Gemmatimonadaceae bacterium]|nr:CoA pyrophosphatase [Gemmatimonadaceae bacterium]
MRDNSSHPLIERIRERLATHVPVVDRTSEARAAAVAIVLRPRGADVDVLFIKRADYELDPWSGQVAFPGGRHEPADKDLLETALRETTEEIGVDLRGHFDLLGRLDDLHSQTVKLPNVFVRPFVIAAHEVGAFHLSPEVADAFWVPLSFLTTASNWQRTEVSARGLSFDVTACLFEGRIIWGMTERILTQLLELAVTAR